MTRTVYDCSCDAVIDMQELGVGVEEILQYVRGTFSSDEIRHLLVGLEQVAPSPEPVEQYYG